MISGPVQSHAFCNDKSTIGIGRRALERVVPGSAKEEAFRVREHIEDEGNDKQERGRDENVRRRETGGGRRETGGRRRSGLKKEREQTRRLSGIRGVDFHF